MIFDNRLSYLHKTNKIFTETSWFSFDNLLIWIIKCRLNPDNSRIDHNSDQNNIKIANTDEATNTVYK